MATRYEPAAASTLVSAEEFERTVDRFIAKHRPYSQDGLEGMLADFAEMKSHGLEIVSEKTGDPRSMLQIEMRGAAGAMETLEARWRDFLRLAGESVHHIDEDCFRFATRGRVGGEYVTGTVQVSHS